MSNKHMNLTLKVWRQKGPSSEGSFVNYEAKNVSEDASFLEMLDAVNEELVAKGDEPIAFDHDCREGICGMCSMYINGRPHGPWHGTTTCQLHMRAFKDGDTIVVLYVGHAESKEKAQFFIKPEKCQLTSDHKDLDPAQVLAKIEVTLKDKKLIHKYERDENELSDF